MIDRRWPPAAAGAALIVGSALAFALDGPVAQAAYRQGLDPATFGFWRASAGALVLGGCLAARLRPGAMARIWRIRRAAAIRLALAAARRGRAAGSASLIEPVRDAAGQGRHRE